MTRRRRDAETGRRDVKEDPTAVVHTHHAVCYTARLGLHVHEVVGRAASTSPSLRGLFKFEGN